MGGVAKFPAPFLSHYSPSKGSERVLSLFTTRSSSKYFVLYLLSSFIDENAYVLSRFGVSLSRSKVSLLSRSKYSRTSRYASFFPSTNSLPRCVFARGCVGNSSCRPSVCSVVVIVFIVGFLFEGDVADEKTLPFCLVYSVGTENHF